MADAAPRGQTDGWFTVAVTCSTDAVELLADVLWQSGPPAVEERASVGADTVVLLAGYPDEATAERTAAAVTATGGTGVVSVTVTPVEDDGLDGWRAHAQVVEAGPFTLVPAWLEHEPDTGDRTIRIDPGPTFGSGSHPTTRLVLAATADLLQPGQRVLDVGCGSGVLAIAAAMCGATAVGLDIDPASAAVTAANAALNGVEDRIAFDDRPLATLATLVRDGEPGFELVLANLLSPIVVELADDLVAVTEPGGHLVVSGLLSDRQGPARDALFSSGELELIGELLTDGWVSLTFRRRPL